MLSDSTKEVDLLFRIPELKTLPPQFLEFKRSARVSFPSPKKLLATTRPEDTKVTGNIVSRANLKLPAGVLSTAYTLREIEWVRRASDLPYQNVAMPSNWILQNAQIALPAAFEHIHTDLLEMPSQQGQSDHTPLAIPKGYGLVYLLVSSGSDSSTTKPSPPKPVLVDLNGRQYPAVGYAIQGTTAGKSYQEFAYSNRNAKGEALSPGQGIPPGLSDPPKFFARQNRLRRMSFFYLIPQGSKPVGLIGVRMKDPTEGKVQFWSIEDGIDAVVDPARQ